MKSMPISNLGSIRAKSLPVDPITITVHGQPVAVLMPLAEYTRLQQHVDTLRMVSDSGLFPDLQAKIDTVLR